VLLLFDSFVVVLLQFCGGTEKYRKPFCSVGCSVSVWWWCCVVVVVVLWFGGGFVMVGWWFGEVWKCDFEM